MRNLLAILGILLASAAMMTAQPPSELPAPDPDRIGKRGAEHVRLDPLVGSWATTIKIWEGPEQDKPIEMSGSVRRQWIYGGRFLEERIEESSGTDAYLNIARGRRPETKAGVVYRGMGLLGYDRLKRLFEHMYIHDDSTRMYYKTGRYSPERNVIELTGTWTNPYNGVIIHSRVEIRIDGPDRHTLTRYISDDEGPEFKDLEVIHIRK